MHLLQSCIDRDLSKRFMNKVAAMKKNPLISMARRQVCWNGLTDPKPEFMLNRDTRPVALADMEASNTHGIHSPGSMTVMTILLPKKRKVIRMGIDVPVVRIKCSFAFGRPFTQ